jgi:hypothetical protein
LCNVAWAAFKCTASSQYGNTSAGSSCAKKQFTDVAVGLELFGVEPQSFMIFLQDIVRFFFGLQRRAKVEVCDGVVLGHGD